MGESDNYGLQFFINGKPLHVGDFGCGRITMSSPNDAVRFAKLKSEMDTMAENYKPIADKLLEEIYESAQESMQLVSEQTTKEFEDACNNYLETASELSKSLNPCLERLVAHLTKPTKRNKHYKPKFTL